MIAVLANDVDPDGALDPASVVVVSAPAHGTASVSAISGAITYTHTGTSGDAFDSFAYTVEDDAGSVSSAPAAVEVALVPAAQIAITSPTPARP